MQAALVSLMAIKPLLVLALNDKTGLHHLDAVVDSPLGDDAYRKTIDLADTDILAAGVGTLCQTLQMDTHVLQISELLAVHFPFTFKCGNTLFK